MADYLVVPRTTSNNDDGFYLAGVAAYSRQEIGVWKVAYKADAPHTIRMGCYRSGVSTIDFVFVAETALYGLDIRLVSPTAVTVRNINSIWAEIGQGYTGYYNHFALQIDGPIINYTVFTSLTNCLRALAFASPAPPPPIPPTANSIVVSVNASGSGQPDQGDITVEATAYIDGADFIIVEATAGMPDDDPNFDPNQQGGYAGQGGGMGTFDDTSDPIPIPPLPSISASGCGLVTLFKPTLSELQELGDYLWTNLTDFIENLNKLFMNPMDYIINLNILPCSPETNSPREINIGSVTTSISMAPVKSQWFELDCGTIQISEYWGSALDYAPNTKISLFLPFIGSVTLNTDEVMGNRLGVRYRIDLLSGQCVAMVTVSSLVNQTDSVYYQYTGECAVSVPLTGADWSRIYSAAIGAIGAAITGGIAAGAAGAAAGSATSALAGANAAEAASNAGLAFSMINDTSKGIPGVQQMRRDMIQASQMALDAGRQAASAPARVSNGIRAVRIANTVNNTIGQVVSGKGMVQHTGTISGNAGMLGVKTPYVMIEYPNQSLADNYKHFVGYPSNMYARLGDLSGYTECEQVLAGSLVNQTDAEMSELVEALKGGVYL